MNVVILVLSHNFVEIKQMSVSNILGKTCFSQSYSNKCSKILVKIRLTKQHLLYNNSVSSYIDVPDISVIAFLKMDILVLVSTQLVRMYETCMKCIWSLQSIWQVNYNRKKLLCLFFYDRVKIEDSIPNYSTSLSIWIFKKREHHYSRQVVRQQVNNFSLVLLLWRENVVYYNINQGVQTHRSSANGFHIEF